MEILCQALLDSWPATKEANHASETLRRHFHSFGNPCGEPVPAMQDAHTWPLGWTVGSIGGDSLCASALCPQAVQQTVVVQIHNVDQNPTLWEHGTTPFHRTNWLCGPTPLTEHSAVAPPPLPRGRRSDRACRHGRARRRARPTCGPGAGSPHPTGRQHRGNIGEFSKVVGGTYVGSWWDLGPDMCFAVHRM